MHVGSAAQPARPVAAATRRVGMLPRCRAAAAAAAVAPRRALHPGSHFRNRVRSRLRFAVMRHWLLDTYGRDTLAAGSGVADIGGGGGDVAFQLCNVARVPATIIDPRQPCMWKCVKKLSVRPAPRPLHRNASMHAFGNPGSAQAAGLEQARTPQLPVSEWVCGEGVGKGSHACRRAPRRQ